MGIQEQKVERSKCIGEHILVRCGVEHLTNLMEKERPEGKSM